MQLTPGKKSGEFGGVALEYIIVTTFAAVVGLSALGFVGKIMQEKLNVLAQRSGSQETADLPDVFDDQGIR